MTGLKRLTPPQSRKVNSLVKKECCNCDNGHCILLDDGEECVCPQLISYSLLCKWFQTAVLPLDIAHVPYAVVTALIGIVLMVVNKIDRTKNDMVMDMPFVYVGS